MGEGSAIRGDLTIFFRGGGVAFGPSGGGRFGLKGGGDEGENFSKLFYVFNLKTANFIRFFSFGRGGTVANKLFHQGESTSLDARGGGVFPPPCKIV